MKIGVYLQMLIVEESDQPDSGPIRVCLGVESCINPSENHSALCQSSAIFLPDPSNVGVWSLSVFN